MDYLLHIVIMISIYTILILAANLPVGMANLLTLAQGAFYGIGAYLSAWLLLSFQIPVLPALLIVGVITGIFSLLISYASLRLKGDFFILATLGFQLIVFSLLYNWTDLTRGPFGIPGIPAPLFAGYLPLKSNLHYAIMSSLCAVLVGLLFYSIMHSPFGRTLKALRTDELQLIVTGRNILTLKSLTFFLSAVFSAFAGFIFASYVRYIDPTSFTLDESIFIISALFIGGLGNVKGSIAGALFIVLLPELLRFAGLPDSIAANSRQIIYGLSLVVVMMYFPKGIAGNMILR